MYNILWNDILSHINPSSSVSICSHLSICSSILEDCKFAPDRIDAFKTLYIVRSMLKYILNQIIYFLTGEQASIKS